MRSFALLLAALSVGAIATPAASQPYPGQTPQPYPGQPGYNYPQQGYPQGTYPQQQGGLGGIIGQLLGGQNYAANDQQLIAQCAAAAQSEVARRYPQQYRQQQGYGQPAYGYNQPYAAQARVTAITSVQRRNRNMLRVMGVIDSGTNGYGQPPYGNAYGYNRNQAAAQQGDLRFNCSVDTAGRVSNLRLTRLR